MKAALCLIGLIGIVSCFASDLVAQNAVTIPCSGEAYTLVSYEDQPTERGTSEKSDLSVPFNKLKIGRIEKTLHETLFRVTAGCLVNEAERRSYPTIVLSMITRDPSHSIETPIPLSAGKAELTWTEQLEPEELEVSRQKVNTIRCQWAPPTENECLFPLRHAEK